MERTQTRNFLKPNANGVTLAVRVRPKSKHSGPKGLHGDKGDELVWSVTAAPVDNAANDELERSVAKFFGIAASAVSVIRGRTSRSKIVQCAGVDTETVIAALGM